MNTGRKGMLAYVFVIGTLALASDMLAQQEKQILAVYGHSKVITLDEMPGW